MCKKKINLIVSPSQWSWSDVSTERIRTKLLKRFPGGCLWLGARWQVTTGAWDREESLSSLGTSSSQFAGQPHNLHLHHSPHSSRSIQFRWMWNKKIFCCRRIIRWKIISMLYISFNDVVCKARRWPCWWYLTCLGAEKMSKIVFDGFGASLRMLDRDREASSQTSLTLTLCDLILRAADSCSWTPVWLKLRKYDSRPVDQPVPYDLCVSVH